MTWHFHPNRILQTRSNMPSPIHPSLVVTLISLAAFSADGALISGVGGSTVTSVDLTAAGSTHWAAWNRSSNTNVTSASANYTKTGGTGTISAITTTNPSAIVGPPAYAATVRGTNSSSSYPVNPVFTWSSSDSSSSAPSFMSGIFHTTLTQDLHGVHFSITDLPALAEGLAYRINVYATSYNGASTITLTSGTAFATLNGETKSTGRTKTTNLFEFNYNPDSPSTVLDVDLRLSGDFGDSGHAAIQGVAISVIPEPSTSLLAFAGVAASLLRRNRKNA
jgi:hypothetical protein